jgi:hypothetical protein
MNLVIVLQYKYFYIILVTFIDKSIFLLDESGENSLN